MNAWLITWEGTDKRVTEANKIAGVLSGRQSASYIEKLVDFLYHRTKFDGYHMAHFANKRKARENQSKVLSSPPGHILYGTNPLFLYARQVKEFKVNYDDENNIEIISWVEQALYGNDDKDGYKVKEMAPEKKRSIKRPNRPIVEEPIDA